MNLITTMPSRHSDRVVQQSRFLPPLLNIFNWVFYRIEDTAFCGVFAHGFFIGDRDSYYHGNATRAADTYVNHHHIIDSNVIHNVGRLNAGAAGVWLHASGENRVRATTSTAAHATGSARLGSISTTSSRNTPTVSTSSMTRTR